MIAFALVGLGFLMALGGPEPVVMAERTIGPASPITGGKVVPLKVGELSATLFIPDGWKASSQVEVWAHFHSADWYVISEYQRGKSTDPVVVFNFGQGSVVYAKPFTEMGSFKQWESQIEIALGSEKNPQKIAKWHFSSFSAGYGAVRNLIADPDVLSRLGTVILCDSLYGSLDSNLQGRVVLEAHAQCWKPLVERAIKGDATVIMTTSQITPETYAGTWEVAKALVAMMGGTMNDAVPGSNPAAEKIEQTLLRTFSKGRWFVWSYAGETPMAHMTHARRLAELIQESKKPSASAEKAD